MKWKEMPAAFEVKRTRERVLSMLFCVALGLSGCLGSAPHPESIIRDHIQAIREGDVEHVYDTLSPTQRGDMSFEEFEVFFNNNRDDIIEEAKLLEQALERDRLEVTAGIPIENQGELALRHRLEVWWIDDDPLRFKPLNPPKKDDDDGGEEDESEDTEE